MKYLKYEFKIIPIEHLREASVYWDFGVEIFLIIFNDSMRSWEIKNNPKENFEKLKKFINNEEKMLDFDENCDETHKVPSVKIQKPIRF